jgi:hypothetical protein
MKLSKGDWELGMKRYDLIISNLRDGKDGFLNQTISCPFCDVYMLEPQEDKDKEFVCNECPLYPQFCGSRDKVWRISDECTYGRLLRANDSKNYPVALKEALLIRAKIRRLGVKWGYVKVKPNR